MSIVRLSAIFFVSGFAGLIYESIWTHYLKLFLGHAAYAQTLVLGIFMGGMAIGAALISRYTANLRNPLRTYALVEVTIGACAIAFHPVFVAGTDGFYDLAFASGLNGAPFLAAKWGLATLLILPQSILLGATFPLFAAAATRTQREVGYPVATLYFANSIGGALGVLASGFVLIPALQLPGTIMLAGCINIGIGLVAGRMARGASGALSPPAIATGGFGKVPRLLLAVSFLTGASSFIYEIGWIRMLSLVLGSATHSFELMLCAFITGLALGGLWIRGRIDSLGNPGAFLAYVQLAMGVAAIATLPLYNATFDLVAWVLGTVEKSATGYSLFNLVRYGIAALVMFPAAFCAGMTLPLATRLLHSEQHQGERAIGMIYSANTIGAIVGLGFAVHVGLPVFGLEYLVATGALVDVALGLGLLAVYCGRAQLRVGFAVMAASIAGTALAATTFNPNKMTSGVFRTGKAKLDAAVLEISHGRTATISVEQNGEILHIRTNGKADASAFIGAALEYRMDEVTMALAGALPLMLHEAPERVANIGFGSGITSATLLGDPRVARLDSIEIEPKMVELARHFWKLNRAAYTDPRSTLHYDDAKSFFAANGKTYDIIVSEPSNPWVSGVAGLFSAEFYRHVGRYLNDGGLFVQWMQVYETHPDRVASVMKALDQSFDDYLVLALNYGDLLLIARNKGALEWPDDGYARLPETTRQALQRLEIVSQADIALRVIGSKALFKPWIEARQVPANSDFAPYLDNHADYDRFVGKGWFDATLMALSPLLIPELLGPRPALPAGEPLSANKHFGEDLTIHAARLVKVRLLGEGADTIIRSLPAALAGELRDRSARIIADCQNPPMGDKGYALAGIATKVLPYLSGADGQAVLAAMEPLACFRNLAPAQALWPELLLQVAARDARKTGVLAEQLLGHGQGATAARAQYLLGMAVLGRLRSGEKAQARALWEKYQTALGDKPLNLGLEILRAHSFSG